MILRFIKLGAKSALSLFLIYVVLTYGYALFSSIVNKETVPVAPPAGEKIAVEKEDPGSRIFFGDLHVHTTQSVDAFMWNLPGVGGFGVRPVAEACNFARYCSGIDFFSSTDHAESLTFEDWNKVKEDVRQCNETAGDPEDPDLVAFSGFEWTQITNDAKAYYGHKNVIFKYTDDDQLPVRPISSWVFPTGGLMPKTLYILPLTNPKEGFTFLQYASLLNRLSGREECASDADTKDLPEGCREMAPTAASLFEKLDQWGLDALVIPHGTAWGLHVPPDADYISQLPEHDPKYQRVIEIYSGHGNSERYKEWKLVDYDENGNRFCPEPTDDYLPCCWRAGEIVRERCAGSEAACEAAAQQARSDYVNLGYMGFLSLTAKPEEWLDCGLCRDCYNPPLDLVPNASVQRIVAASMENGDGSKKEFKMGFIGSTDTHRAKAGHGYAPLVAQTDAHKARPGFNERFYDLGIRSKVKQDWERNASYFYVGGLAAVHAENRSREAIWEALMNKNTYGTSGPRILLWFDLLNSPDGVKPMGSDIAMAQNPTFMVKAIGSPKLLPGCPDSVTDHMGEAFVQYVCNGQCYNPSNERYRMIRIEVVKIHQQKGTGEDLSLLIQDPYKVIACPADSEVCEVTFTDMEYIHEDRTAAYYVRAIQEETDAVNGNTVNCDYDESGKCVKINPCDPGASDCMGRAEERAWSSPIYLSPGE